MVYGAFQVSGEVKATQLEVVFRVLQVKKSVLEGAHRQGLVHLDSAARGVSDRPGDE